LQQYQQIKTYLKTAEVLTNLDQKQQKKFKKQAAHYFIAEALLYRKSK
ncbi:9107_t:CDS:1, partial [Racocetra persica]